jgi:hypothetical protein
MLLGAQPSHHGRMKTFATPQAGATDSKLMDLPVAFGVMGLPFAGGHYLAFRDFPATSFSPS